MNLPAKNFSLRKKEVIGNTIVNTFRSFKEIVYYKRDFKYFIGYSDKIDRGRKYYYDADGFLCAHEGEVKIRKLMRSLERSIKRAKDNFYGYAFSNEWQYFITLTVDPKKYGKSDEDRKRYLHIFENLLNYYDAGVKFLIVWEEHHNDKYGGENNGTLHFHGLVTMKNIENHVVSAINKKTGELLKTRTGRQIYNFSESLWKYGFSNLVPIESDNDSQEKVVSYMCKYMTKGQDIKYNARRFYRSRNLLKKDKKVLYYDHEEIINFMNNLFCNVIKENSKMIVMRVYKEFFEEFDKSAKSFGRKLVRDLRRYWRKKFDEEHKYDKVRYSKSGERILTINKRELEYLNTIF